MRLLHAAVLLTAAVLIFLGRDTQVWLRHPPCLSNVNPKTDPQTDTPRSPYSASVEHALQYAQSNYHESSYFRELAAALLAAPRDAAAARGPYQCSVTSGTDVANSTVSVYPISFSVPAALFLANVPPKAKNFSTVIPGLSSTYRFRVGAASTSAAILAAEDDYHKDMGRSMFAVTYKKGGWDCMRHLEILAAGTLPIFTDIKLLPSGTMAAYPVKVLQVLNRWPGLVVKGLPGTPPGPGGQKQPPFIDGEVVLNLTEPIDRAMYQLAAQALLQYGQALLSTAGMARYLMKTVGIQPHHRILFFGSEGTTWQALNDYQADTLLHGLQSVMTVPVVDVPRTEGLYIDATTFTEDEVASCKTRPARYGGGFSYAYRLHEPFGIDRSNITQKLQEPLVHFDYVIFGVTHRWQWQKQGGVCGKWPRERVVLVHGGDLPAPTVEQLQQLHACGAHIFLREMAPSCHSTPSAWKEQVGVW